ncbi:hypothetical protein BU23DRAFT_456308 [Bimuria novae-zelandiae CBS 107.79]|uniref:Uncharacterized protein n=1 Tax=Bimuria novae-zelandiae CBS 107.79 TaxID=1447943 RepID=A0A6A5VGG6_9PLEO|nr:hypothetical protein BU23DRAFT_456308 [Bimuria novae-zelandiae CBS 107.79]
MPTFFDLPRELRDLLYEEVLLWQRPRPELAGEKFMVYDRNRRFKKVYEPQSSLRGEFGCAYALEHPPSTCASFLACNRQIYAEMKETMQRLGKKGLVNVRLDCIAEDESFHYFTWLGVPLVRTTMSGRQRDSKNGYFPEWIEDWVRYLSCPLRLLNPSLSAVDCIARHSFTTQIARLWIDIRIVGDRSNKWRRNSSPPDRTGWAICAALKRLFDKGPYLPAERDQPSTMILTVEELVLNVVPPPPTPALYSPTGVAQPKLTVAKELVNVWSKIWAGDEFKGIFYAGLLERIGWLRVCVGGEMFRVRELSGVLERGQKERRRIAERGTSW